MIIRQKEVFRMKKIYRKPEVKEVRLTPEDAVLANCKSPSGTNKQAGRCRSAGNCKSGVAGS